jgi:hypothetical protein
MEPEALGFLLLPLVVGGLLSVSKWFVVPVLAALGAFVYLVDVGVIEWRG